jgi:hypothetical protein
MTWSTRCVRFTLPLLALSFICTHALSIEAAELTIEIDAVVPLSGAVLIAYPEQSSPPKKDQAEKVTMLQVNRQFDPFILPVPANVPVEFPNQDSTAHHVYSFSPVGSFELPLYKQDTPEPLEFSKPGVIPLGCNIHDWMIGYLYVVDSPWYIQLTENEGTFTDLPAGRWSLRLWHPSLEGQTLPTWGIDVGKTASRHTLPLHLPVVAVTQPEPPAERFDESWEY